MLPETKTASLCFDLGEKCAGFEEDNDPDTKTEPGEELRREGESWLREDLWEVWFADCALARMVVFERSLSPLISG